MDELAVNIITIPELATVDELASNSISNCHGKLAVAMAVNMILEASSSTVASLGNCDNINGELVHGGLPRQL